MLVVFPYSTKDQDQAVRLAEWIQELGPYPNHRVLIVRDRRCDPAHDQAIVAALYESLGAFEVLTVNDDAYDRWPDSANVMFRNAAKHIEFTTKTPFLWMEPDAIPLKSGWLDTIEDEYQRIGKPFMGDRVEVNGVPLHMSGVAVYPGIMSAHAGLAYLAQDIAWDVAASQQIVPQAHFTSLILHAWKHPSFTSWEMVEREILAIKPEAVLFHADKTSGLIDRLRERRNNLQPANEIPTKAGALDAASEGVPEASSIGVSIDGSKIETQTARKPAPSTNLTCDIFIKSYPADYLWLSYCLRSIERFASGFRQCVVTMPTGQNIFANGLNWPNTRFQFIEHDEHGHDGYLSQQIFKLHADTFSDADMFCILDSDTIFTKPITPETYFTDGKINWMMTPYSMVETPWKPITEKFLGRPVEFEFMRRAPTILPRWLLIALREFCVQQHGRTLEQYIMAQPHRAFSEFNAIGAFAYYFHHDKFNWINTAEVPEKDWPVLTVLQKKSWDGLSPEIIAEFEAILKGDESCPPNAELAETGTAQKPNVHQTKDGIWVLNDDSHISKWVEERGSLYHDHQTLPVVLPEIQLGDWVVDVGANIGDSTAPFLERVGPSGKVFAFEPHPDAFTCLVRNCPDVACHQVALSDKPRKFWLLRCENAGASNLIEFTYATLESVVTLVNAVTLDSFKLEKCDFIKIDVEGFELNVLRGAEETINRFHPKLLIEINEGALQKQDATRVDIWEWLYKHGYENRKIQDDASYTSPQFDVLCTWKPEHKLVLTESQATTETILLTSPGQTPWENREQSTDEIRAIAERLKAFMGNSVYTRRVRDVLHETGVIQLPYRFKKRKGKWRRKAKA